MKEVEDSEREAMETQLKGKKPCCSSLPDADRSSKFEEGRGSAADVDPVDKSYSNILTGRMLTVAGFFDICMKNEVMSHFILKYKKKKNNFSPPPLHSTSPLLKHRM